MKWHIFFDFDGTIADTFSLIVHITNTLAERFRYRKIHEDQISQMKKLTVREVIQTLEIPLLKIPMIINQAKKDFQQHWADIRPFPSIIPILHQLHAWGYDLAILSSNSRENVERFLTAHGIAVFKTILTTSRIWNKNKPLEKHLTAHKLDRSRVILIGDEVRDIEAARRCGIRAGAVAWGYNTPEALQRYHPEHLFHRPEDIIRVLHPQPDPSGAVFPLMRH